MPWHVKKISWLQPFVPSFRILMDVQVGDQQQKSRSRLVTDAVSGLETELQKLVKENGISDCSLDLVMQGLTSVRDLSIHLYRFPEGREGERSQYLVRKKLSLEVLGGLYAKGIDVNEDIKKALNKFPSFSSLMNMKIEELGELKNNEKLCAALEEMRKEAGLFSHLSKPVLSEGAVANKNAEEKRLKEEAEEKEQAAKLKQI